MSSPVELRLLDPGQADEESCERARAALSEDETRRLAGFLAPEAARLFLLGRALLRATLGRRAGVAPADLHIGIDGRGKPFVGGPPSAGRLRFNLAHTRGLVALAVTEDLPIGVDVEACDRDVELAALARIALAPEERALFDRLAGAERVTLFYRVWTLKEAYVKALGTGFAVRPEAIAFDLDGPRLRRAPGEPEPEAWRFHEFAPTPGSRLALAAKTAVLEAEPRWTRLKELGI